MRCSSFLLHDQTLGPGWPVKTNEVARGEGGLEGKDDEETRGSGVDTKAGRAIEDANAVGDS
eukprot:8905-Eustigmatos_ZCMA.PRE.1